MLLANTVEQKVIFRQILGKSSTFSNHIYEIFLKKIEVHILEMEDVLFHHNSAVMMPENPAGESSQDGTEDDLTDPDDTTVREGQEQVTGIKALALVFKQFEFDPTNKIVIAGHTDTSGQAKYNFELSEFRAQSVLFLLTGEREKWAENSYKKQKIEDYQQILKYIFKTRGWPCDPGNIDDDWGTNTRQATENFINRYNSEYADKQNPPASHLSEHLIGEIQRDGAKRWPKELWAAVYDLYSEDLAKVLLENRASLDAKRNSLLEDDEKWVDPEKKFVGCGESFPIDDSEKDNYRSQSNRRVVILFFDKEEAPELDCPADIIKVHEESKCPLWHGYHFMPLYIFPTDLQAVVYHLSFKYYDRIEGDLKSVPEGLNIRAFENESDELLTTTKFKNGVYSVKVQFKTPLDDGTHKDLHFEFNTNDQWVLTEKKGSPSKIVTKTVSDIQKLDWKKRQQHYDLPGEWSSRNYWTRYDGDINKGERFEKVIKEEKKLKPFGSEITKPDKPLVFSLDDIVLIDENGNQNINNSAGIKPQDLDQNDNKIDLSANSRLTLFNLLEKNEFKLEIYKPIASHPYFSDIDFSKNLIPFIPEKEKITRFIIFCSTFYDIYEKRTKKIAQFKFEQGHVLGARAAVKYDPSIHQFSSVSAHPGNGTVPASAKDYVQYWCGNYELHYLHHCGILKSNIEDKEKPLSYLIIYWNCRFARHADTAAGDISADWRQKYEKEGMINSMNRTNRPYLFEKKSGTKDFIIRPYHFYEAKLDNFGGKNRCKVEVSKKRGAWMQPILAKFHENNYKAEPGIYDSGSDAFLDVDGQSYTPLTSHHEMGHATGCFDDYLYNLEIKKKSPPHPTLHTFFSLPRFGQPFTAPGGPYSIDFLARMFHNRIPRMRNYWHFLNWINDESGDTTNKKLKKFLDGTIFSMTYKFQKDGKDKVITLDLWDSKYRDTCKAAHHKINFGFKAGSTGNSDLLLYRLGGGETAHTLDPAQHNNPVRVMNPRIVFDAILVIRLKIGLKFINDTKNWSLVRMSNWMKRYIKKPTWELTKYYLKCNKDNDFKNTIILFRPHFSIYDAPVPAPKADWVPAGPPADSHFNVEVKYNDGNSMSHAGKIVRVENKVDKNKLISHFFGKSPAGALTHVDLDPVANWVKNTVVVGAAVAGTVFSVETIP